jgi:hypothetical protein
MSDAEHKVLLAETRSVGREQGIDKTLKDFDIDVIIGPADSSVNLIIAAAGKPLFLSIFSLHKELFLTIKTRISLRNNAPLLSRLQRSSIRAHCFHYCWR